MAKYFPCRPTPYFTAEGKGRFRRELVIEEADRSLTTDIMATAMGDYIQMLDTLLGIYLTHLTQREVGVSKIEEIYTKFLKSNPVLI